MRKPGKERFDTYFAMLENPELRRIELSRFQVRHKTSKFDPEHYALASGVVFEKKRKAYKHWVKVGRQAGLEYAPGRDTLLKIVLKAKNERHLIDAWVEHHAAIVGYENLIIADCGSDDPAYIEKLAGYADRILILSYPHFYDMLHATRANLDFYGLLTANCRYLTVLDADEFLFARSGDAFSPSFVKPILRGRKLPLFAGIWVNATAGATVTAPSQLDISPESIVSNAPQGKSIARNDLVIDIGHLGHNLHFGDVVRHMSGEAFGEILVLHVKALPPSLRQERLLAHLVARGFVEGGLALDETATRLTATLATFDPGSHEAALIRDYLDGPGPQQNPKDTVTASIICQSDPVTIPALARLLEGHTWEHLVQVFRDIHRARTEAPLDGAAAAS